MLSYSNIVIPAINADYQITSYSNGVVFSIYSFFQKEGENRHYSLTKRGPTLLEHQKKKCGNPLSVFSGLSRSCSFDPKSITSFLNQYGRFTPFNYGYYDGNTIETASRRLLCLLEIIENYRSISQDSTSAENLMSQYTRCLELLVFGPVELDKSGDWFDDGVYAKNNKTGEIVIGAPCVYNFIKFLCGGNGEDANGYTPSSFDLTQGRIKTIADTLRNVPIDSEEGLEYYYATYPFLPGRNEREVFHLIERCSVSARFYVNGDRVFAEPGEHPFSKSERNSLQKLSALVIERELNYYTQPIKFRYSVERKEAVPNETCVHQLMYFSLMTLERDAVYVPCSKDKCNNMTVKLFEDKIIPCCCTSCRSAAASKRNRDIPKYVELVKQDKKNMKKVPPDLLERVKKRLG